jgi:hypothetical protein
LAKFKFNIFFLISIICILILVGYLWIVFLPTYERTLEYDAMRNVIILITAMLSVSAVLTLLQMTVKE